VLRAEVDLGSAAWHGDAYDGDAYYGLVKVEGHLGLKVVCLDCIHGPVDLEDRAWRGELTAEEERALRDWWEAS
jgi:hypothetical protein